MSVDLGELVRTIAARMKLLDPAGKLIELDSLTMVDLASELEAESGITIPVSDIRTDVFSSVEGVVALLQRLSRAA